jgi:hypothetical protein
MFENLLWLMIGATVGVLCCAAWLVILRWWDSKKIPLGVIVHGNMETDELKEARDKIEDILLQRALGLGELNAQTYKDLDEALIKAAFMPSPDELKALKKSGLGGPCMVSYTIPMEDDDD